MVRRFFKKDDFFRKGETRSGEGDDAAFADGPTAGAQAKAWVANTFGQITGYGADKLEETAERLNSVLPYIERAGFRVIEIEVNMGVTPAIIPHVQVDDVLPKAERPALMAELEGRPFATGILSSLFRAADFGKRIDLKGFDFFEIEIELGVIPSVTVKYAPRDGTEMVDTEQDE